MKIKPRGIVDWQYRRGKTNLQLAVEGFRKTIVLRARESQEPLRIGSKQRTEIDVLARILELHGTVNSVRGLSRIHRWT